uniref:hypothetical protein n=1 Tax=Endozoicomonas sp. ONNA2 TaxID=2828741 RepID=UPI002148675C
YRRLSMTKLHEHWQQLTRGYGLDDRSAQFVVETMDAPEGIVGKASLPELEQWVRDNGEE